MSRRTSRKISNIPSYNEDDEIESTTTEVVIKASKSPKRGRKGALEEQVSINELRADTVSPKKAEKVSAEGTETIVKAKKSPAKSKVKTELPPPVNTEEAPVQGGKNKRKVKAEEETNNDTGGKKSTKKRKTKEEKDAEAMPLAARTAIQVLKKPMYIGAHVSAAGGVQNSINNAMHIGGNSFALFLKSQRKWTSPPLATEARDQFHAFCTEHKYDASKHILPHGSYLVNLAAADAEKADQAYNCFLDDLQRCESLGIKLYNFHPGNTNANPRPEAIARIAGNLNKAHKATKSVVTLLENMAGTGNTIGSTFEDLRDIIALVQDKSRVGVCIDTCHSFAAGYDLRTPDAFAKTMESFDRIVGKKYLRALHLNDSKAPFGSHRDLHANIGTGFLGLRAFHNVMNCAVFEDLPMVLETPIERQGPDGKAIEDRSVWAAEIKLLEGLVGMDVESEEFKADEERLNELGKEERAKFQGQADKKVQKTLDSMFKKSEKGKKKKKGAEETDSDGEGGCSH